MIRSDLHVLVIPSWYPRKDAPLYGIYFKQQIQGLVRRGLNVGVVYPEARSMHDLSRRALLDNYFQQRYYEEDGVPTLRLHGWNVFWRLPWRMHARIRQAQRMARTYVERFGRPQLIHAHSARWAATAAARIGRAYGIPYVVTEHYHEFHPRWIKRWQARLAQEGLGSASRVVAVSNALQRWLEQQDLVAPGQTTVIPNLIDEQFFTLPPQPKPQDAFRFFALGTLYPWKGYHDLLQAFAQAFGASSEVVLEIGGMGPERRRLEREIHALGLDDYVSLLGKLSRKEVRAALWRAHAFVHPSFIETFGIVLIEAMATGLPVVATASGGPEDIVDEGVGLLVAPENVDALAGGLREIVSRYDCFDEAAIRQYAVQHFGMESVLDRIVSLYAEYADPSAVHV